MAQVFIGYRGLVDVLERANRPEQPLKRWNAKGKCKRCGALTSALGRSVTVRTHIGWTEAIEVEDGRLFHADNGTVYLACRGGCGVTRVAMSVLGKYSENKPCNDRCMGATGHDCQCTCAGRNHGKAHSV